MSNRAPDAVEPPTEQGPAALLRPLGTAERFYWLFDRVSCTNFVVVAHLDPLPTASAVRSAFAILAEEHPLLRARIAVRRKVVVYERSPEPPALIVRELATGAEAWPAVAGEELDARFSPHASLLVRCTLLRRGVGPGGALLVTFHHGLADGASGARLVLQLCRLAGEGADGEAPQFERALVPAQESVYPAWTRGLRSLWWSVRHMLHELVEPLRRGRRVELPRPDGAGGERRPLVLPRRLGAEETRALAAACRAAGTTVQGALGAAQLCALRQEAGEGLALTLGLASAVDMRSQLAAESAPTPDDLGHYASLVSTRHRVAPTGDLWTLARDVRDELVRKLRRGAAHLLWSAFPPAGLFPPDERGVRRLATLLRMAPTATIVTNLGRLPEAGSSALMGMDFAMAPQTGCALCTAAATYAGELHLTLSFDEALISRVRAEALADDVLERLHVIAKGSG